jgi:hypothetical protein
LYSVCHPDVLWPDRVPKFGLCIILRKYSLGLEFYLVLSDDINMLDRIMIRSKFEVVLIFTDRPQIIVSDSNGKALALADQLLAPRDEYQVETLSEWLSLQSEDTQKIDISDLD